jgi:histidyl-tRNA synthetase
MLAQRSCWHDNKIYAKTTWVISNCHIEMLVVIDYVVDLSITRGLDIYKGQTNRSE